MERKKLIFFASADPRENPKPARTAYHFASTAAKAGLEAEVRLAGDGVRVAHLDTYANSPLGEELRDRAMSGASGPFLVSL
jgi:predicted peroxiredoxin